MRHPYSSSLSTPGKFRLGPRTPWPGDVARRCPVEWKGDTNLSAREVWSPINSSSHLDCEEMTRAQCQGQGAYCTGLCGDGLTNQISVYGSTDKPMHCPKWGWWDIKEQFYSCQGLLLKGHYSDGFTFICCWIHFDLTNKAIYLVFLWLIVDFSKFVSKVSILRLPNHNFAVRSPYNLHSKLAGNLDFAAPWM